MVRGADESAGAEERVRGAGGSDPGGGGGTGPDTGESGSNLGGGALTTGVCTDVVSESGGTDTEGVVVAVDIAGGAGIGLLGLSLDWPPGVTLAGWGAVPLISAGMTGVVFCCCQAMVSPSEVINVAANNPTTRSTRRVRRPLASSTCSSGMASIGVVDGVS